MTPTTFGNSAAAKYLADELEKHTPDERRKVSRSMANFNQTMNGLRVIADKSLHTHVVQLISNEPRSQHPPLIFSLMVNLRMARKRVEINLHSSLAL